jgi:hypothetical protein
LIWFLDKNSVSAMQPGICPTSETFYRMRRVLMEAVDVDRQDVRPSDRLEDVIPPERRRAVWKQLRKEGFRLAPLSLSPKMYRIALAMHGAKLVATAAWGFNVLNLVLLVPLSILTWLATRRWAIHIRYGPITVRDAVIVSTPTKAIIGYLRTIRSEARYHQFVSMRVRLIIAEAAGVPLEAVQPDSRLVDLGLD